MGIAGEEGRINSAFPERSARAMMVSVFHDELNRAVRDTVARAAPSTVAKAFVTALRLRKFEHWSPLASFAVARTLPMHEFEALADGHLCRVCGASARVDAFESDRFSARAIERRGGEAIRSVIYSTISKRSRRKLASSRISTIERSSISRLLGSLACRRFRKRSLRRERSEWSSTRASSARCCSAFSACAVSWRRRRIPGFGRRSFRTRGAPISMRRRTRIPLLGGSVPTGFTSMR